MPNKENIETLESIKEDLNDLSAMWVVDYRGLTVAEVQDLRRQIRESDAIMKVYKNTLMHLALKELDMVNMDEVLSGPNAFVFAKNDPVGSAKVLKTFAKEHEVLEIKAGIMDGEFYDKAKVLAVAALPSREELLAKLVGTLQNPMAKTVRVLNGPLESFARTLSAIAEQKGAA